MRVIADVKASGNVLIATTPYKLTIKDGKYEINIKPFEGLKRSQRQNAMMWGIVNKICKKINGNLEDNYELYNQLLEMAGVEYDNITILDKALPRFKELVKHVKVVNQYEDNGQLFDYCWVFKGISEMTTKEATELIEMAKQYANRVGVEIDYWEELEGYSV